MREVRPALDMSAQRFSRERLARHVLSSITGLAGVISVSATPPPVLGLRTLPPFAIERGSLLPMP